MGEDNQAATPLTPSPSRAALVANDLARASTDPGFQLLLRALANIAQEESDHLNQSYYRMYQEIQRERRDMDISNQKAQALDTVVAEMGLQRLSGPQGVPGVIDHVKWLKNEAQGFARAQDLSAERFGDLRRAAGKGAEEIPTENWGALTEYVKSLVPNEDK